LSAAPIAFVFLAVGSCMEILQNNPNTRGKDGVYSIKIGHQKKKIVCDMTTNGGGWTVSTNLSPEGAAIQKSVA
jgi:hypothetical protein